MLHLENTWSRK